MTRLGLAWWLAAGLVLLGCQDQKDQEDPASGLELRPPRLNLGVVTQHETVRGTVELANPAASAVRVRAAATSGRCRWQGLPETIAGRTTIPLALACQSDLLGPLGEQLPLLDATTGTPVIALQIVGRVEPIIGFDPTFVDLRPDFGQTASADVRLIGKRAAHAVPRVTSTGAEVVTAMATDAAPGLRVSCNGNRVGMHAGSIVVETGISEQPTLTLSWGCRVPATLVVEPANPYFNLRASGDGATTIVVRSSQAGFRVKAVRVGEGPFRATVEKPRADGSTPITIRARKAGIPDDARAAIGKLLILSNDAREPRKEVPLFGFGRVNKRAESD